MSIQYDVKDLTLAEGGRDAIEWADGQMPVLSLIRERFVCEQPLKGVTLAGVDIDKLTAKQEKYLASWEEGT